MTRDKRLTRTSVDVASTDLLESPLINKGTAFSHQERLDFELLGLLPPDVETIEQQADRCHAAFQAEASNLDKHIFLRNLQDENETLFYHFVLQHTSEVLPIIYTPVVGEACQQFSRIYRRPRGVFISYPERDQIDTILKNCVGRNIQVIVVTDGERILGLGDQGAGGMGIPIGKLSLYTAIGGIHPAETLPITLDVGTNNTQLHDDPLYIGWRHERISGSAYNDFLDTFVAAVTQHFPNVLLQWEDFASHHAAPILSRYRDQLCTFNDDIQGTAAVATGTLLAAIEASGTQLTEHRIVMLGAGSAGVGISSQLVSAMVKEGMPEEEARARFFLIDINGLIHEGRSDVEPYVQPLSQRLEALSEWPRRPGDHFTFEDTVLNAKPTILVGATGQGGVFTERIIREMSTFTDRPIIFPLSNPTSRCEAQPADLIEWTEGRALIATGSPFPPVAYQGQTYPIAQCNNSYIFPAMGLAIRAVNARRVTDEMFMAAAIALKETSPALLDSTASLLPSVDDARQTAQQIAIAVAHTAIEQGLTTVTAKTDVEELIRSAVWWPEYMPYTRKR